MDRLASATSRVAWGPRGVPRKTAEKALTKHATASAPMSASAGAAAAAPSIRGAPARVRERAEAREGDQPLAHETVQGRQAADRNGADQEGSSREAHAPEEPAERVDLPGPGRVDHGAGRVEQERLEGRVVPDVEEAAGEPEHGPVEPALRHPERADAEPDQDDADVLDRVVREEALEIVLRERHHDAEDAGRDAESHEREAEPCRISRQHREHAHEAVDPHLQDDAREQRRDVARGRRVRVRESRREEGSRPP